MTKYLGNDMTYPLARGLRCELRRSGFAGKDAFMTGMLTLGDLKTEADAGRIDTVVVAMTDMAGQLIGKRFHARYFLDSGAGKPMRATICSPTTSTWSRCPVTPRPVGDRAMAISF
jgi:hypothetical protein